jgi:uncharacterized protein YndB with AHSA1/START domain
VKPQGAGGRTFCMLGVATCTLVAAITSGPLLASDNAVSQPTKPRDFRQPTVEKWRAPRAVVDAASGLILATAEVPATPQSVIDLFTTNEIERWWRAPGYYRWEGWTSDLRVEGQWSTLVRFDNGDANKGWGEYREIDTPRKLVMTRRFEKHPLLDQRETTITFRFEPTDYGTRVTVRDEGFIGRSEAAFGNAEHWERVLGWLNKYLESDGAERPNSSNLGRTAHSNS